MKVERAEIHKKIKTKDELNVPIGLDSNCLVQLSCPILPLLGLVLPQFHENGFEGTKKGKNPGTIKRLVRTKRSFPHGV